VKTELNPRSFDACMNAAVLIIVILDCSEIDMEISDTGIETTRFNDCREVSENDSDTSSVLTTT